MAIKAKHKDEEFGVGDRIRVIQKVQEGDKIRKKVFEGIVISIRGRKENKSYTVRRMGVGKIGIERIFPIATPAVEKIEVVKHGTSGVRRAKLYYIREKSRREIEKIYSRAAKRNKSKKDSAKTQKKSSTKST